MVHIGPFTGPLLPRIEDATAFDARFAKSVKRAFVPDIQKEVVKDE